MIEFLKTIPNIIKESAKSALGILSLMILLLFFITISFFYQEDAQIKVLIFILLFLGVVLFGISIYRSASAEEKALSPTSVSTTVKKRKYVYLILTLVFAVCITLFYYILFLQTHYKYYKSFTRTNTGWTGQTALTKEQASHSNRYFKFIYKGRLLQEVDYLHGAGGFVLEDFDDIFTDLLVNECHAIFAVKVKFNYDKEGLLIRESLFEQTDRPLVHLNYSQNGKVIRFEYDNGATCSKTKSNIKAVNLVYNNDGSNKGKLQQIMFCNDDLKPMPNKDNLYGFKFTYFDNGQLRKKMNLNRQGGTYLYYVQFYYDANLSLLKQEHWGEDGNRYLKNGVFAINTVRNSNHDIVEETYFDDSDKPTYNSKGYFKLKMKYDDYGNIIEESHWATNGTMTASMQSGILLKHKYDDDGHVTETAYFNAKKLPSFSLISGAHIERTVYNNQRVTGTSYFDENSKATFNNDGIHREENIYDEKGYLTEKRLYGTDGHLKAGRDGAAVLKNEFNDKGLRTLIYYLDENSQRVSYTDPDASDIAGQGGQKLTYSENNQLMEVSYLDINDKPIAIGGLNGIMHKISYVYNTDGSLQEERYINLKNALIDKMYAYSKFTYDSLGRKQTQALYDKNNKPYSNSSLPFQITYVYNKRNQVIEMSFKDSLNKFHYSQGYCKRKQEYDAYGRKIRIGFFDENDNRVMTSEKLSSIEYRYNIQGKVTEERYFDQFDNLIQQRNAVVRMVYNNYGQIVKRSVFDHNDREALDEDSVSVITYQNDRYGRTIAQSFYGLSNKPVLYQKYHKAIFKRDEYGNNVFNTYLDTNLKPVLTDEGAYSKIKFTRYGKLKETHYYDINKQPLVANDVGAAIYQVVYNGRGFQIGRKFLDKNYKLIKNKSGIAEIKETRDEEGKIIAKEYFDELQKPVNSHDGFQKTIYSYDKDLTVTERRFDVNGKEVKVVNN